MLKFHHGIDGSENVLKVWHRFLHHLRNNHDITPICIFDSAARMPQKSNELIKRKATRALLSDRAQLEMTRGKRVDDLKSRVLEMNALPAAQRDRAVELIAAGLATKPQSDSEPAARIDQQTLSALFFVQYRSYSEALL